MSEDATWIESLAAGALEPGEGVGCDGEVTTVDVLKALRSPASAGELASADASAELFARVFAETVPAGPTFATRVRHRSQRVATITTIAVLVSAGSAAATGNLPGPAQRSVARVLAEVGVQLPGVVESTAPNSNGDNPALDVPDDGPVGTTPDTDATTTNDASPSAPPVEECLDGACGQADVGGGAASDDVDTTSPTDRWRGGPTATTTPAGATPVPATTTTSPAGPAGGPPSTNPSATAPGHPVPPATVAGGTVTTTTTTTEPPGGDPDPKGNGKGNGKGKEHAPGQSDR